MQEEEWGWPGATGASLVLAIFFAIAITAAVGWPWILKFLEGNAAAWVQALGSLAAVSVALGFPASHPDGKGAKQRTALLLWRHGLVASWK